MKAGDRDKLSWQTGVSLFLAYGEIDKGRHSSVLFLGLRAGLGSFVFRTQQMMRSRCCFTYNHTLIHVLYRIKHCLFST